MSRTIAVIMIAMAGDAGYSVALAATQHAAPPIGVYRKLTAVTPIHDLSRVQAISVHQRTRDRLRSGESQSHLSHVCGSV